MINSRSALFCFFLPFPLLLCIGNCQVFAQSPQDPSERTPQNSAADPPPSTEVIRDPTAVSPEIAEQTAKIRGVEAFERIERERDQLKKQNEDLQELLQKAQQSIKDLLEAGQQGVNKPKLLTALPRLQLSLVVLTSEGKTAQIMSDGWRYKVLESQPVDIQIGPNDWAEAIPTFTDAGALELEFRDLEITKTLHVGGGPIKKKAATAATGSED